MNFHISFFQPKRKRRGMIVQKLEGFVSICNKRNDYFHFQNFPIYDKQFIK